MAEGLGQKSVKKNIKTIGRLRSLNITEKRN
jgi:hypothetical protein